MARSHFAGGNFATAGRHTFGSELFVGEFRKDRHRLSVQPLHQFERRGKVGGFRSMRAVAAGFALHVFRPHVALRGGDLTQQLAEREFSFGVGPIHFVWRDAARHAQGAFADVIEISQERVNGADFHDGLERSKRQKICVTMFCAALCAGV